MPKKIQITKLDIVRWIAVLPAAVFALLIYGELSSWLNKLYLINFHGDGDSFFTVYIDCIAIPLIVLVCGYFISPKFKFRSALILISFFALTTIYALLTNEYLKHEFNPFIAIYFLTASFGLFVIYKIDSK
jgi:hypothetical protein